MKFRLFPKKSRVEIATDPKQELAGRFPDANSQLIDRLVDVTPFTMTSPERLLALCDAIEHIENQQIAGDIVECGVWRGGSMMAAAKTLVDLKQTKRTLWLYDTYDGMSDPGEADVDLAGNDAGRLLGEQDKLDAMSIWCRSTLPEVKQNLQATGYPTAQIRFVEGKVEETIPKQIPEQISLLRLDTDWYESTLHELTHLYPRLQPGGILIIDDYGHWKGCRRAVDEYFAELGQPLFLHRIDYTGRLAVKPLANHDSQHRAA